MFPPANSTAFQRQVGPGLAVLANPDLNQLLHALDEWQSRSAGSGRSIESLSVAAQRIRSCETSLDLSELDLADLPGIALPPSVQEVDLSGNRNLTAIPAEFLRGLSQALIDIRGTGLSMTALRALMGQAPTLCWMVDESPPPEPSVSAVPELAGSSSSAAPVVVNLDQTMGRLGQAVNPGQLLLSLVQEMVAGSLPLMQADILTHQLHEAGLPWVNASLVKSAQVVFRAKPSPELQAWVYRHAETIHAVNRIRGELLKFLQCCPFRADSYAQMTHALALIGVRVHPSTLSRADRREHVRMDAAAESPAAKRRKLLPETPAMASTSRVLTGLDTRWQADVRVRSWLEARRALLVPGPDLRWNLVNQLRRCGAEGLTTVQLARIMAELGHEITRDSATEILALAQVQPSDRLLCWFEDRMDIFRTPGGLRERIVAEFAADPPAPRLSPAEICAGLRHIGVNRSLATCVHIAARIDAVVGNTLTAWLGGRKERLQGGDFAEALQQELLADPPGHLSVRNLGSALKASGLEVPARRELGRILTETRLSRMQLVTPMAAAVSDESAALLDGWVQTERRNLASFSRQRWDLAASLRALCRSNPELELTEVALESSAARQQVLLPPSCSAELLRLALTEESAVWRQWVQRHDAYLRQSPTVATAVMHALLADWPEDPDDAALCLSLNNAGFRMNLRSLSQLLSECKNEIAKQRHPIPM